MSQELTGEDFFNHYEEILLSNSSFTWATQARSLLDKLGKEEFIKRLNRFSNTHKVKLLFDDESYGYSEGKLSISFSLLPCKLSDGTCELSLPEATVYVKVRGAAEVEPIGSYESSGDLWHPHISQDGLACLGECTGGFTEFCEEWDYTANVISRLIAIGEFPIIREILQSWYSTYNPSSEYISIKGILQEDCPGCDMPVDECQCSYCDDCGDRYPYDEGCGSCCRHCCEIGHTHCPHCGEFSSEGCTENLCEGCCGQRHHFCECCSECFSNRDHDCDHCEMCCLEEHTTSCCNRTNHEDVSCPYYCEQGNTENDTQA